MPAPLDSSYSVGAVTACTTAILGLLDAGAGAGKLRLYSETDVLLADINLSDPAGTIDAPTGRLDITAPTGQSAIASAECTWGELTDSDNNVVATLPAQSGSTAVPRRIVLSTTALVNGAAVELVSCTIGG